MLLLFIEEHHGGWWFHHCPFVCLTCGPWRTAIRQDVMLYAPYTPYTLVSAEMKLKLP